MPEIHFKGHLAISLSRSVQVKASSEDQSHQLKPKRIPKFNQTHSSTMKNVSSALIFISLLAVAFSYRVIDFQNDEAELDEGIEIELDPRADLTDMIEQKPKEEVALLMSIEKKLSDLKSSNEKLRNDLKRTQNELSYQAKVQNNRQRPANVQLTTKYDEDNSVGNDFWQTVCKISKNVLGFFFKLLGINL
jgi:hypothetical protein